MTHAPLAGRVDPESYPLSPRWRGRLLSPAVVVDLDRIRRNIGRIIESLGSDPDRWRPHLKTTKLMPVFAELVRAGIRAFKCATTREAACLLRTLVDELGDAATGDLLLAYPLRGPNLARLVRIADAYPAIDVSVLCEDPAAAAAIPPGLSVFADVNPGMNRTGIPADRHPDVVAVARAAGDRFRGIHYYEGHLHDLDEPAGRAAAEACYRTLSDVLAALDREGITVPELITSGTPAFRTAAVQGTVTLQPGTIHRVSPGTVVAHDTRSEGDVAGLDLEPAAVVFARVVSHPAADLVTCDAGSKSIATDAGDPCAVALGWPGLRAEKPSEEHLPLRVTDGPVPERGAELILVPRHVCPTINLAEQVVLLESGRDPRLVPVDARAHDSLVDDPIPAGETGAPGSGGAAVEPGSVTSPAASLPRS